MTIRQRFRRWGRLFARSIRSSRACCASCPNTGIRALTISPLTSKPSHEARRGSPSESSSIAGQRRADEPPNARSAAKRSAAQLPKADQKRRTKRSVDSVAVLPLENLSRDENLDYLTDGLTESLINNLSQLPRLKVMARSTVFRYKGREIDPQEIGQRSRRQGRTDRARAAARRQSDDWRGAGRRRRRLPALGRAVQPPAFRHLDHSRGDFARDHREPTHSADAGRAQAARPRSQGQRQRLPALSEGPVLSRSAIAECRRKGARFFRAGNYRRPRICAGPFGARRHHAISATVFSQAGPRSKPSKRARTAANRALELDEADAEAHASLAFIKYRFDWDWTGAEIEFKRALALNPGHAQTRHWFGMFLASRGRLDLAFEEMLRAREVDPLSSVVLAGLGRVRHLAGRHRQAIELFQQVLKADPRFVGAHFGLIVTLLTMGEAAEAIAQLDLLAELLPNNSMEIMLRGMAALKAGHRADAERALARLTSRYQKTADFGRRARDPLVVARRLRSDPALAEKRVRRTWLQPPVRGSGTDDCPASARSPVPRGASGVRSRGGTVRSSEYFPSESGRTKDFGVVHQGHEAALIGIPLM